MKVTRACKWGASALLMIAPVACAVDTEYTDGELGWGGEPAWEDEFGTVEQQIVTQTEKNRINAKRTANSWLGAPYDPNSATAYWETTGGIVRQYNAGAVLYNRLTSAAYVADWDAYYGWSWIGGSQFGYPNGDQRAMASNSSNKVLPFAAGFIVTKPSNHDNWPIRKTVNANYSNGGVKIWCSYANTQNQLGLACQGLNFPPNTTVKIGYSGRTTGMGHAVTKTTNSSGGFTADLRPGNGTRVDAYNGVVTVFARASTGVATYTAQDYAAYSGFLIETNNKY